MPGYFRFVTLLAYHIFLELKVCENSRYERINH